LIGWRNGNFRTPRGLLGGVGLEDSENANRLKK
jgi:hypothetical protein